MRWLYVCWIFILIFSCGKPEEEVLLVNFDPKSDNLKWKSSAFPVAINFDESFTADEQEDLNSMIDQWEIAAGADLIAPYEVSKVENYSLLSGYYKNDPKNSVVMAKHKVEDVESNVLATCQLYLELASESETGREFYITQADIIFNGHNHEFNNGGGESKYDLKTVFLHEMGHFLGLLDEVDDGVMKGIISTSDIYASVGDDAAQKLRDLYELTNEEGTTGASYILTVDKLEGGQKNYTLIRK